MEYLHRDLSQLLCHERHIILVSTVSLQIKGYIKCSDNYIETSDVAIYLYTAGSGVPSDSFSSLL